MGIERNYCAEAGCSGVCCGDIKLNGVSQTELDNVFPGAQAVENSSLGRKVARMGEGVYFARTEFLPLRPFSVQLVKVCPNLLVDGSCGVQDFKPASCRNETIGNDICDGKRLAASLPVVDRDLAFEARRLERIRELQEMADAFSSMSD